MPFNDVEALRCEAEQLARKAKTKVERENVVTILDHALELGGPNSLVYSTRCKAFEALKKYDLALIDITRAASMDPNQPVFTCKRADILTRMGRAAEGVDLMGIAIDRHPMVPAYRYQRAKCLQSVSRYKAALGDLTVAVEHERRPFHAYLARAKCYIDLGLVAEAKADLNKARKAEDLGPEELCTLGKAYCDIEMYERAQGCFENAIRRARTNPTYHVNLGQVHYHLRRFKEARQDHTTAIRLDPENTEAFYCRGLVSLATGNARSAVTDLDVAVSFEPSCARYHHGLGLAYQKCASAEPAGEESQRHWQHALHCFERARLLEPNNTAASYHCGLANQRLGNLREALDLFQAVLARSPEDALVYESLGLVQQELDMHGPAVTSFSAAVERNPANAALYHSRGESRHRVGEYKLALKDFNTAVELGYREPEVFSARAMTLNALDRCKEAVLDIAHALDELGEEADPELFFLGSVCSERIEDLENALLYISEAIRLDGQNCKFYLQSGTVNRKLTHFEDAQKDLFLAAEVLGSQPNSDTFDVCSKVHYNLGLISFHLKSFQESELHFGIAISFLCGFAPKFVPILDCEEKPTVFRMSEALESRVQDFEEKLNYTQEAIEKEPYVQETLEDMEQKVFDMNGEEETNTNDDIDEASEQEDEKSEESDQDDMEEANGKALVANQAQSGGRQNCSSFQVSLQVGICLDDGDLQKAKELLLITFERAKARQLIGLYDGAASDLSVVIYYCEGCANAFFCRAFAYKAMKQYKKAAIDFERAKELDPENPNYVVNYRKIYPETCRLLHSPGNEVIRLTRRGVTREKHK